MSVLGSARPLTSLRFQSLVENTTIVHCVLLTDTVSTCDSVDFKEKKNLC